MKLEWKNALLGGVILSVSSILGNVLRGDPHTISTFPDFLTLIVFAVVLTYSIRACRVTITDDSNPKKAFIYIGLKVSLGCAIVLTIALIIYGLLIGFPLWFVTLWFVPLSVFVFGIILLPVLWMFRSKIFHGLSATA
jgi:hypothetical protein